MSETLTSISLPEHQEHCSSPPFDSGSGIEADRRAEEVEDISVDSKEQRDFVRAEIDTSAPFGSVKEAVSRFGGIGFWKPRNRETESEPGGIHISEVEKQKTLLAAHLVEKESKTLQVLKELEQTNRLATELKSRLLKEQSEHDTDTDEMILMELNQEKMKKVSVTEASIELLKESIASERNALEATRRRLATNSLNISSLEKELTQTRKKLELVKESGGGEVSGNPIELSEEILRLSSETEELKIVGEVSKSELFTAMLEIEQTKSRIKIAEMSLAAANRMKEAAKKAQAAALSEAKRLKNDELSANSDYAKPEGVSLSQEAYEALVARARDAEHLSNARVQKAMQEVDEANISKMKVLMKVERATEEVKMTKLVMENALRRVETANLGKLAVEESLRQRRSAPDHSKKRRAYSNSTKFKTVGPSEHRKERSLHDVNRVSLVSEYSVSVLRPTLSIGQILNNKLHEHDQPESGMNFTNRALKRHESLGQMLGRRDGDENCNVPIGGKPEKATDPEPTPRKSNKFTFGRFSLQLASQSKKKKAATTPRFMMCKGDP